MKKVIRVFCDIVGTFTSQNSENRAESLRKFASILDNLALENDAVIDFSFLSDNDCSDIQRYIAELQSYLTSVVILRKHFGLNGYIEDGEEHMQSSLFKPLQIQQEVESDPRDILDVYYFDDSKFYTDILKEETDNSPKYKIYLIQGGLENMNNQLSSKKEMSIDDNLEIKQ